MYEITHYTAQIQTKTGKILESPTPVPYTFKCEEIERILEKKKELAKQYLDELPGNTITIALIYKEEPQ